MGESELAAVLNRRRQEVDTRGNLYVKAGKTWEKVSKGAAPKTVGSCPLLRSIHYIYIYVMFTLWSLVLKGSYHWKYDVSTDFSRPRVRILKPPKKRN